MKSSGFAPELKRTEGLNRSFVLCGRKCYLSGMQDGTFPDQGWHTIDEMGGVWTHPLKIADGFWVGIETKKEPGPHGYKPGHDRHFRHWLGPCDEFVMGDGNAWVEHRWDTDELNVVRRQFIPHDEPAVGIEIDVSAKSGAPVNIQLNVLVRFDILPVWHSEWPEAAFIEVETKGGKIIAHAVSNQLLPAAHSLWTAALGTDTEPGSTAFGERLWGPEKTAGNGISALLKYPLTVDPTAKVRLVLAGNLFGEKGAVDSVDSVINAWDLKLQEKIDVYRHIVTGKTVMDSPEKNLDDAFLWSKLNLEWLMVDSQKLGTGATAGLLDFPFYFGVDTDLSIGGFLAAGLHEEAKQALRIFNCVTTKNRGRVPHELVTNGGVFSWGHIMETSLYQRCVWQTYLWTGDQEFLREMYPICCAGMLDYVLSQPSEDGILLLEYEDLPDSKRNKSCPSQVVVGFESVAKMAERLGDDETAKICRKHAEHFLKQVEELFWMEDHGYYAGRLGEDNKPIAPPLDEIKRHMHPGIFEGVAYSAVADAERVKRALALFEDPCYTNKYGLYFDNSLVFNMPITTGCAAVSEFTYGRLEPGMRFVRMIEKTLGYVMPGAVPEYISADGDPEKANPDWCYLQLWSAALYLEALVLGIVRVEPDAARGKVCLTPRLPEGWPLAEFSNLMVGQTRFNVRIERDKPAKVTNVDGPELEITIL